MFTGFNFVSLADAGLPMVQSLVTELPTSNYLQYPNSFGITPDSAGVGYKSR
jgi:hypothetical protein